MATKKFKYNVNSVPLKITNAEQTKFCAELMKIPYLLYEVENTECGEKILINKPGGKRDKWGRLQRNDFMVFSYNPSNEELQLLSHDEILEDLKRKNQINPLETKKIIYGLFNVCNGEEPDIVISKRNLIDIDGIPTEKLLKVYKWIWGQEDCNYPKAEGRWRSMNAILREFNLNGDDA
jgi:hypothetical protein